MDKYKIFLIAMALVAIVALGIFMVDLSNLSWQNNKAPYWGIIAMIALVGSIFFQNRANKLSNKLNEEENRKMS